MGPGYATFAVYGVGDPGRNSVEVVAPSSMTFDATSDDFTADEKGSTTTHTADGHRRGGRVWAVVSLRDPEQADERPSTSTGSPCCSTASRTTRGGADFVAEQVTKGIPALEKLVGAPWPGGLERIREDASPSLRRLRRLVRPDRRRDRHR